MSIRKKIQKLIRPTSFLGLFVYNIYYNIFSLHKQLYFFFPINGSFRGYLFRYGKKSLKFHLSCKSAITFIYELYIKNLYFKKLTLNKGDTVLDIGANAGLFAVYAAEIVGSKGKVICFEPSQDNIKNLKKNIKYNSLKNVEIVEKGTFSRKDTLNFYIYEQDFCNSVYKNDHNSNTIKKSVTIDVDTVENLLRQKKIVLKPISFIKLDNEESEMETLKGMPSLLKQKKLSLLIPDLKERDKSYQPILSLLKKEKFNVYKSLLPSIHAKK